MPRTLAIGDIHGCYDALVALEDHVGIKDDDTIVTLGDYVDRGPGTAEVLEWVMERHASGQLIPLRGNHEIMMLAALDGEQSLDSWLSVGGDAVLESYRRAGFSGQPEALPESHLQFLRSSCLRYHEIETHFFVHATVYPEYELEDQPDFMLFWEKWMGMRRHMSGKIMVCGHTAQRSGWPAHDENSVCIDTRAHGGGWLTCLDVATNEFWQANQQGETRSGWLDEIDMVL